MNSKKSLKKSNKKKKSNPFEYFLYDFIKVTGAPSALLWLRPKNLYPFGRPKLTGGYMISANHSSFIDPIVILCVFWKRRIFSLATKDLYSNRVKHLIFSTMKCIQVDKENFSLDSFHEVTRRLKNGKVISIFPEGRLNFESDNMLAFKSGIILMAHSANAPILPIYLVPPGHWYQRRVTVVGEPIDVRKLCGMMPTVDDLNRAADYVHDKEQELKTYYETEYLKKKSGATDASEEKKENTAV